MSIVGRTMEWLLIVPVMTRMPLTVDYARVYYSTFAIVHST